MTTTIAKRQNGNQPATFGNVVDNIFQNSLHRFFDDNFWYTGKPLSTNTVPVNIRETDDRYEIEVVAPGCRKDEFRINMNGRLLTVSFEHKQEQKQEDDKTGWIRNEYVQRSFSRNFTLDDTVNAEGIQAAYQDGILRLQLPKNEKNRVISRNIDVK